LIDFPITSPRRWREDTRRRESEMSVKACLTARELKAAVFLGPLAFLLFLGGCSPSPPQPKETKGYRLELSISPYPPPAEKKVRFTLRVSSGGKPASLESPRLVLSMPGHGHPPGEVALSPAGEGLYRADGVILGMAGRWEARLLAQNQKGERVEALFPFVAR
jgi:hypothetical protein